MTYKTTPKDFFLHLLMMGALYVSVFSFVFLIFGYIDILLPDQLDVYLEGVLNSIRRHTATLIIIFPVYLIAAWLVNKGFKKQPGLKDFWLRRWLVYLTLFVAAIAIISGLVSLVYNFLNGELTARFIFKVATVFAVTGVVFWYYLRDIKDKLSSTLNKIAAIVSSMVLIAAISAGFFIVGSPFKQREVRLDQRRVQDLQLIQNEVINYWSNKNQLPSQLSNLKDDIRGFVAPTDPETGEAYGYQPTGSLSFELCADFRTSSKMSTHSVAPAVSPLAREPFPVKPGIQQNWEHGEGRTCFARTIDPDFYK